MQDIPAVTTSSSDPFEQLRSAALVDTSSQARAFADFLHLMSRPSTGAGSLPTPQTADPSLTRDSVSAAQTSTVSTAAPAAPAITAPIRVAADSTGAVNQPQQAVNQATAQASTTSAQSSTQAAGQTSQSGTDQRLNTAKNAPVSREAFEEVRPVLVKAGLSDKDIEEMGARVQAGTLTWGQLVHTLSSSLAGAKKPVELSASQSQGMQAMFQKLGFTPDQSSQMVLDVAKGDGLKVLSNIQSKLASMPQGQSLGVDKDELAGFLKALGLPQDAAAKLSGAFSANGTVADMKNALAQLGEAMKDQRAKDLAIDRDIASAVGRVMDKDVAKSSRDANQTTGTAQKEGTGPQLTYELKTKEGQETSWFNEHDKKQAKAEDKAWREFQTKVRADGDTQAQGLANANQSGQGGQSGQSGHSGQSGQAGQSGRDTLDSLMNRTSQAQANQQAKGDAAQEAAKAFDKTAAPKMLTQVQEALLKDLGQGRKQLTLQLDPENLGKLQVIIQVKEKDVHAVLRAEDPDTAKMLTGQLETIRKTLEDQGLKVQNLEVQTGLAGGQSQQSLFSADQHNQAQERQELTKMFSQMRLLRSELGGVAHEMQNEGMQAILADRGLHIIA